MPKRSSKRKKKPAAAGLIFESLADYAAALGRKGGKASAKARMRKISPARRSEIARKAALARWKRP